MPSFAAPEGKRLRACAGRGGRAANPGGKHFKLVRVDGEAHTLAHIIERTGLPPETVEYAIYRLQKRGTAITWEMLLGLRPNVKRNEEAV